MNSDNALKYGLMSFSVGTREMRELYGVWVREWERAKSKRVH